jgi:hypothetical protein
MLRATLAVWETVVRTRGDLAHLIEQPKVWAEEYVKSVNRDVSSFDDYIPTDGGVVVDIGCGVGAVDAILATRHGLQPVLVDGSRSTDVHRQDEPFCGPQAARTFMALCRVRQYLYAPSHELPEIKADMVISLRSWCFHYPPHHNHYLRWVLHTCKRGAHVVIDLRRERPEWRSVLEHEMDFVQKVGEERKYDRTVWRVR